LLRYILESRLLVGGGTLLLHLHILLLLLDKRIHLDIEHVRELLVIRRHIVRFIVGLLEFVEVGVTLIVEVLRFDLVESIVIMILRSH